MGSKQSKWANDYGSIFINLKEDQFTTGQTVNGTIEMLVKKPLTAYSLDLVFKGK